MTRSFQQSMCFVLLLLQLLFLATRTFYLEEGEFLALLSLQQLNNVFEIKEQDDQEENYKE